MVMLLVLMLVGVSGAWAQTVISTFSMTTENPSSAYDNGTIGGDGYILGNNNNVTYYAQGLKDNERKFVQRENGYKLQDDDIDKAHFKLQFKAGFVKPGDILTIGANQVYNNTGDIKFKVGGSNAVETGYYTADGTLVEITHTIQQSEIIKDGDNEYIRIGRCSWPDNSIGIATFKITRPAGYIVTLGMKDASASGCDAWFTLGDDPTQYRGARTGIAAGTKVVFHASDNGSGAEHVVVNGWRDAGTEGSTGWHGWGSTYTINNISSDLNYEAEFWSAFRVFANAENGATAKVYTNTSTKENVSGRKYHEKVEGLYFETTVPDGYTFLGWDDGSGIKSHDNPWSKGAHQPGDHVTDLTVTAKFVANYIPSCDWGGDGYIQVLSPTSANAGIAPFSVKAGVVTVDKSNYTLSYAVKSGPISVSSDGKITVNSEDESVKGLTDGYKGPVNAYITVTANPKSASYAAGSVDLHVQIKAVTNGVVKLNPSEVRVGDYFDMTVERGTGFPNIKYYWTFPENTTNIYGYNGTAIEQTETTKDGVAIPYQFLATGPTSGKMDIYVRIESPNTATEYKGIYGNGITIKPITVPTINQNGSDVIITYEKDFVNRKDEEVDAFLEYKIGDGAIQQTGFGNYTSTFTLNDVPEGTVVTAKSVVRFKKPDNPSELLYASSDEVTYTVRKPFQKITVNGTEREYDLYVPEGITSGGTVGVVISLHNGGEDVSLGTSGRVYFNNIADANKGYNDKKFVVVSPRALIRDGVRDWQLDESSTDDTEFFKTIVKKINDDNNDLTVDYNRIYLAGYGTGGAMAFKVAHKDAGFYSAIASVSGVPYDDSHLWHAGDKPVPFIFIQGANDGVFRDQIGNSNVTVIAHNMMYRNGAKFAKENGTIAVNDNGNTITFDCHEAENGGAAFYHYIIPDMYHSSEMDWNKDGVDDVVAPTMWAFFNKADKVNSLDETLKFRVNDPTNFWTNASNYGFVKGAADSKVVLTYGGSTKTNDNKNIYHSLQFNGGINGAAHFLKLNVETNKVTTEDPNEFFLVKLTKTGETTPVFAKRYQAGRGKKDLYINFSALPGFNEYKLEITKSSSTLDVKIHGIEAYSGSCKDKGQEENPTAFYDVAAVLAGMNPIYQPVFDKTYNGLAKEYLPIADIPVGEVAIGSSYRPSDIPDKDDKNNDYKYRVINDDLVGNSALTSLPSTVITSTGWTTNDGRSTATITGSKLFNIAKSGKTGEDTAVKSNNAYIFDNNNEGYTIDKVKGFNISEHGRAMMPEYLNGTRGAFPDHGVIAIKLQGTLDFYLLAQNEVTYTGTDPNSARRTLKVYYTNDQLDGELKELEEWWFYGTRSENGYSNNNGNSLGALSAGVRLPQLGKDGTCTVFITYEGREKGAGPFTHEDSDNNKIWIKGFVIKRPDLKVTIGRTDSKYKVTDKNNPADPNKYKGENNTECTRFGENKPYIWSFENVGFNNTRNKADHRDVNEKKVNEKDGRTYVCGGFDDSVDHLLLYSDGASDNIADKVQFDGRVLGKEHIEFLKASVYNIPTATNNRKIYDPIQSNGLKVNVTGSGWFKIWVSAPNGPVNMKVYTQPNYGSSYISLLREFTVNPVPEEKLEAGETQETAFREYTVYLKSRGIYTGNNGFWDGTTTDDGKEEIMRQSLFVVFDNIGEASSYAEGHPQLNIHKLSWLNEKPADYVFQREEDPKLLTTWQEIKRNGKTVLWWKAGNDSAKEEDPNYVKDGISILSENTYDRLGQYTTNLKDNEDKNIGVKSPNGYASTSVPSDADVYEAYWDIAAPAARKAHTEAAYGGNRPTDDNNDQNQYNCVGSSNNTEFDIPVSGSFVRLCVMKNTYVVAHVLPGHNGSVYVLDETGNPIPYKPNGADLDNDAKTRGYVSALTNFSGSGTNGGASSTNSGTMRIDFTANAGKEYFIVGNGSEISLARLEVVDDEYKPEKSSTTLELVDNADNSTTITSAYNTNEFYRNATLTRTFAQGKWASLVLPFSLNEKKFKEIFGKNAKCLHFTQVDKATNTVRFTHHYYNMIVAGRPVFVCPDHEVQNPSFDDITLQTNTVNNNTPYEDGSFTFYGSYGISTIKKNDLYINKNNEIKYLNIDSDSYPGMRAFIQNNCKWDFENGVTTEGLSRTRALFLNFFDEYEDENISTEIESIFGEQFGDNVIVVTKSTKVYDMHGRLVSNGKDINNLPAGIYIVNGKKYIVK